jgi:Bacterial cadherin-like domain
VQLIQRESEIATVTINVTPVNDAPVASDLTVTTLGDNVVTINLIAADADNTPATLVFTIQNAPQIRSRITT